MPVSSRSALVDAGPLIALARTRDRDHERALQFARTFDGRLLTTLAVLTEVCHFVGERKTDLLLQVSRGTIELESIGADDMARLVEFCRKYPQADFADATLVVVAERTGVLDVVSFDETDFSVYRTKSGKHFTNLV
jgi:hypothetical protein